MENYSIKEKTKLLCENSQLSQKQIADFLDINLETLQQIQDGKIPLRIEMLIDLCDLFGLSYLEFLEQENPTENLKFSFDPASLPKEDVKTIAQIQRIAVNIREMEALLQE